MVAEEAEKGRGSAWTGLVANASDVTYELPALLFRPWQTADLRM
jgi:hypothetical protein